MRLLHKKYSEVLPLNEVHNWQKLLTFLRQIDVVYVPNNRKEIVRPSIIRFKFQGHCTVLSLIYWWDLWIFSGDTGILSDSIEFFLRFDEILTYPGPAEVVSISQNFTSRSSPYIAKLPASNKLIWHFCVSCCFLLCIIWGFFTIRWLKKRLFANYFSWRLTE